jgi:hypothetical protein
VVAAIVAARLELDARMELGLQRTRAVPVEVVTVDRGDVTEVGLAEALPEPDRSRLYVEAVLKRSGPLEIHETPAGLLAALVEEVVEVEAPVHVDEVISRVRDAWGLQRAGGRIQEAVERGIAVAVSRGSVERRENFLYKPGKAVCLRDRSLVSSLGLRRPELIASEEIAEGICSVVTANLGATEAETAAQVSRMLGYKAAKVQLRGAIAAVIERLRKDGRLKLANGLLVWEAKDNHTTK